MTGHTFIMLCYVLPSLVVFDCFFLVVAVVVWILGLRKAGQPSSYLHPDRLTVSVSHTYGESESYMCPVQTGKVHIAWSFFGNLKNCFETAETTY